jgi:glycosyltransferase A (GT-A) superfamily protein (DUF2064 family)
MSPPFSLEESADLYAEMLGDVLVASDHFAEQLDLEPVLAFHPPDAVRELVHRAPPRYRLQAQRGSDLAERMAHVCLEAAAAGAARLLIRGSDSPTLSFARVAEVMAGLDAGDDVVITPDQGGGYSLIGLRALEPRLFEVSMSRPSVLEETLARARALGLRATKTASAFDLDEVGDFHFFSDWLREHPDPDSAGLCPRTVQFLEDYPEFLVL